MNNTLIDKTLTGIKISNDKESILFKTIDGEIIAHCYAECCSHTWVEHIELPALGFPATVVSVENIELPGSNENDPEYDCLRVYGLLIVTDRGELVIDYRNSSNGYYGGDLVWPGERYYMEFCAKNVADEDWREISI